MVLVQMVALAVILALALQRPVLALCILGLTVVVAEMVTAQPVTAAVVAVDPMLSGQ